VSHPAGRVLGMLELLQASHVLTGAQLASRLEVDERSVRRYARTLTDLGVPVVAARGRYGGYRLRPGFKLPPLMLTDDEAVAVLLGLTIAGRLGLSTATPATDTALAKIQRVLPAALASRLGAVLDTLGFTLRRRSTPDARPTASVLLTVGAAIRDRRQLRLRYQSWQARQATPSPDPGQPDDLPPRTLAPYGIVFHSGQWYVAGLDGRSGEVRTFRLDRMAQVTITDQPYELPDGFDAVEHVTLSLSRVPYQHAVEVLLETDLATARTRVPATIAELSQRPDGVLLRARAQRLDGMAQLLAGLGWPFTVLGPPQLRAELAAHAARLTDYANRDPGQEIQTRRGPIGSQP
jgi:predicted DNA-binding transcriptional regulator YafY